MVRTQPALPTDEQTTFGIGSLFIDLKQPNVTLTLRVIDEKSLAKSIDKPKALKFMGKESDAIKVDLSGHKKVVFLNLPEGTYQVTQVDVPHFDLPYKIDTSYSDLWRFKIQKQKVNYIGTMYVKAIRSKNAIDTVWINQFATHFDELTTLLKQENIPLPLVQGIAYKDAFYSTYVGPHND